MIKQNDKTLILGIGNSGRSDDGLGWAFLDKIASFLPDNYDIEYRYQLQIEDAELASHYQSVYFVDACKKQLKDGFFWEKALPKETHHFSSHALPLETILYLTQSVYGKQPESYVMGIFGENFDLNIGLSEQAEVYLAKALIFFRKNVLSKTRLSVAE